MKSGDQLFLCVNGAVRERTSLPIGLPDYPLVDGQVYAFDLRDGHSMWPVPAVIEQRGIAIVQPDDLPVLVFVDRVRKRNAGGANNKLRLLCIDRETGATIYRNDELTDTSGTNFRIQLARGEPPTVNIEMSAKTIRLKLTDEPRSPEPPASDLVEAPRKTLGRGLWGVGLKIIQDGIRTTRGTNEPDDASEEPADAAEGQFDDD
jgi:hypothetical protein